MFWIIFTKVKPFYLLLRYNLQVIMSCNPFPKFLPVVLLLIINQNVCAQDYTPIVRNYMKESNVFSPLYNGTLPPQYKGTYDGTYFLESEEYFPGAVVYDGKKYEDLSLNLNAHLDELYVRIPGNHISSVLIKSYVTSFHLGDMAFLHITRSAFPRTPEEGYFRVLFSGEHIRLFKRIKKNYISANPNETRSSHLFETRISYYMVTQDGMFHPVKTKGSLLKVLQDQKKPLKKHISENELKFKSANLDQTLTSCAAQYEKIIK